MVANGISIDYGTVGAMADVFERSAEALQATDVALELAVGLLRASAFVGAVGNELLAQYLANIRPHVQRVAATCLELSHDLREVIRVIQEHDEAAAARFGGDGTGRTGASVRATAAVPVIDGGLYTVGGTYNGSYESIDCLFVNGIDTELHDFQGGMQTIGKHWNNSNIVGVYNDTEGMFADIYQATHDRAQAAHALRLDGHNPAVRRMADVIVANAQAGADHDLTLIGHSQGGAIVAAALNVVKREHPDLDLSFLHVYTLGSFGVDYPPGPTYHMFVHQFDPVPTLAHLNIFPHSADPVTQMRYYNSLTVLTGPVAPLEAHSLQSYMNNWEKFLAEEKRVRQGGVVSQAVSQMGEVAQFHLNPWGTVNDVVNGPGMGMLRIL